MHDIRDPATLAHLLRNIAPGIGPLGALTPVADGYSATVYRADTGVAVNAIAGGSNRAVDLFV